MDECHFRKMHVFKKAKETAFASRSYFFYIYTDCQSLSAYLEDLLEMPIIIPIRCQNQPHYMMEGSEGEAWKKCISLSSK